MTVKELKDRLRHIDENLVVCVFADCKVYDVLDTQLWVDNGHDPEFELGCGFVARGDECE
jgi:hypothetical protein